MLVSSVSHVSKNHDRTEIIMRNLAKNIFGFMTICGSCGAVVKQRTNTGLKDRRGSSSNTTTHEPSTGVYMRLKYKFFSLGLTNHQKRGSVRVMVK
jgi:hypothetical protein